MHKFGFDISREALEAIIKIIMAVFISYLLLVSCSRLNEKLNLKDDNIFEETLEEVIEYKTGIDWDLTPGSTEN